ncbi:Valyl-tRNA synthetase [Granulibacter bethesdensis]|nr:Valyl-tRNA synthetase [Granulibacter bethesdensis]
MYERVMLSKNFDHAANEQRIYAGWEHGGAFAANPESSATPFTIMIPPPNVTGSLHMGHALTFTLQDSLVRWRRMQGRDVLWQPGTDHAGIATQMVVERLLVSEGSPGRREMGRDAFLDRVWRWKAESGGNITHQLRRLGASLDWGRERFTMDDGLSAAVRDVFVTLYRQGLIYRDRRLVNWDPQLQTAISDLEVESREVRGNLWHIRYPLENGEGSIIVATTRPETMLGDSAVAVHPEDERYTALIGKCVILPLTGRRIPIVADTYSDPEKGTGAVKITPAHDFNDFSVGRRHDLPMPSIMDREGRITIAEIFCAEAADIADPAFVAGLEGQERFAARKAIVARLEEMGFLETIETHTHQVPHGDRSGVPIEPLLTTQWFCNAAELAKPAVAAVESGDTRFVPKQWENTFFAWLRDIQPWCISRQLWWGHRIPAWYAPDGSVYVAATAEEAQAAYGGSETLTQDEDVLDTWFSSALWPFSTLGWPEDNSILSRYYPTDVLITGFDIIFFWVARMMMMGLHIQKQVPFRDVYIHGLVRDERGQKMSKSKGNVIDPLALIEAHGADPMRFAICLLAGPGRDIKLGPKRVEDASRFVTKLWNASVFCERNGVKPEPGFDPATVTLPLSRWILASADDAIRAATQALEAYRFDDYAATCYRFVWNTFCDWFVELAKPILLATDTPEAAEIKAVAAHVLGVVLRLLHPAMPYVTETLWDHFGYGPEFSLIRAPWPEIGVSDPAREAARQEIDWLVRLIGEVRTVRNEMNVPPSTLTPILLKDAVAETVARAERWRDQIARLARASSVTSLEGALPKGSAQAVLDEAIIVIPLEGVIDLDAERIRLTRERDKARDEASKVVRKLENADFVARAKPEVVEENRDRLAALEADIVRLGAALERL